MSTIKVDTIQNTSGVEQYLAKAWVNFNGTGTVAIRASGNVTSITDNGTGDYTVNFTNAFNSANYCSSGTSDGSTMIGTRTDVSPTASAIRFVTRSDGGTAVDSTYTNLSFHGDLA